MLNVFVKVAAGAVMMAGSHLIGKKIGEQIVVQRKKIRNESLYRTIVKMNTDESFRSSRFAVLMDDEIAAIAQANVHNRNMQRMVSLVVYDGNNFDVVSVVKNNDEFSIRVNGGEVYSGTTTVNSIEAIFNTIVMPMGHVTNTDANFIMAK